MSTTTTLAIGSPPAFFTFPVIVTVARAGVFIFSTGEAASEIVEAGAVVDWDVSGDAAGCDGAPAGGSDAGITDGDSGEGDKEGLEEGFRAGSTAVTGSDEAAAGAVSNDVVGCAAVSL